ncbi:hypothetical protein ACV34A_33035, partial [Pseudomonas aeruginosa]
VSLAAHEPAAQTELDLQARDLPDLLRQLDGRSLRVGERALTLATAGATVERQAPDWRSTVAPAVARVSARSPTRRLRPSSWRSRSGRSRACRSITFCAAA